LLLILGLGTAACTDRGEPQLHFEVKHWDLITGRTLPHPPEARRVEVSPIPTGIHITGAVVLPDPCDKVEARLEQRQDSLRLRVRIVGSSSHGVKCGVGSRAEVDYYEAEIGGLSPGTYQLQVLHDFGRRTTAAPAGGPSREVVLDQSVLVSGPQ
jgi:hypothetical protein